MVVEVMGRHAGHIATWAGIAGGATMVLIPEEPFDIEEVCDALRHRHENRNRYASIVVVAEGATPGRRDARRSRSGEVDAFGHVRLGGIGDAAGQGDRGSAPATRPGPSCSATSSGAARPPRSTGCSSTRFGIAAIDAVHDGAFGQMVALRAGEIVRVPLAEATGELKLVDPALYEVAEVFFG